MDQNKFFQKLLIQPINNLINDIIENVIILSPIKNAKYKRNVQYTIKDYVIGIIDVVKNYSSWNSYKGAMNKDTLRLKFNEWSKLGIFEYTYKKSLTKYLKTAKRTEELKYQTIDSTFIEDINGSKYSTYSGIYKRRKGEASKGIKITSLVTTKGIPISVNINQAHNYDTTLLPDVINKCVINCNTKKYYKHNRYKQYLLADSGYDSKLIHQKLIKKGYIPIIKQNKRNIKNKKLIRVFNNKQKEIYRKRKIIENYHSWIKKFPKIKSLYERNIEYYKGLLFVGISIIINRRIINNKKK